MDSLFSPHTILQSRFFFLICHPWKFATLGPGPCDPCVNTALLTTEEKAQKNLSYSSTVKNNGHGLIEDNILGGNE
jgi:hypothetical protein